MKKTNTTKAMAVTSLLISLVILIVIILPFQFGRAEKTLKNEYDRGLVFSGFNKPVPDGYNYISNKKNHSLVLSKIDIFKPTYTLVYSYADENVNDRFNIEVIQYERINIIDWKINSRLSGTIKNKPFQEAVSLAQKYDLSKENPDPENITVFPPLKPSSSLENTANPQGITIPDKSSLENK